MAMIKGSSEDEAKNSISRQSIVVATVKAPIRRKRAGVLRGMSGALSGSFAEGVMDFEHLD